MDLPAFSSEGALEDFLHVFNVRHPGKKAEYCSSKETATSIADETQEREGGREGERGRKGERERADGTQRK